MAEDVLIVDRSAFGRRLLRHVVTGEHEVVGAAENGVEALELYRDREPSVVVTETAMPIRDGIDAVAEMTADGAGPGVVICSADEDAETVRAAREAGADEFVTKPYQAEALLAAIEAAAGG